MSRVKKTARDLRKKSRREVATAADRKFINEVIDEMTRTSSHGNRVLRLEFEKNHAKPQAALSSKIGHAKKHQRANPKIVAVQDGKLLSAPKSKAKAKAGSAKAKAKAASKSKARDAPELVGGKGAAVQLTEKRHTAKSKKKRKAPVIG